MKKPPLALTLVLFVFLPVLLLAQNSPAPDSRPVVLTHVTVIDATGSPPRSNLTVVVRDHRISAIRPDAKAPAPGDAQSTDAQIHDPQIGDAQIIDATGKFLIPGLWDMHVHTGPREIFLPLYIANGVTGVRDMGGDLEDGTGELSALSTRYVQLSVWREAIEQGTLLGPHIVMAGFLIDGFKWPGDISAANADEGREAVDALKRIGVDFIKVKSFLSRDAYFAITVEAQRQHMVVAGHVPDSVRVAEASDAGQKSVEHLIGVVLGCSGEERQLMAEKDKAFAARDRASYNHVSVRAAETFDNEVASALFSRFVRNGTWQVPTLVELRRNALGAANHDGEPAKDDLRLSYLPKPLRDWWSKQDSEPAAESGQLEFATEISLARKMHNAGVLFMAGTDSANPSILPGFSLHDELKLLVTTGFSPLEALQTATINPARYLGRERDLGTVEVGKLADLVLLDSNPLDDITNTQKIRAVVVNGRYLSRQELDSMLSAVKTAAK